MKKAPNPNNVPCTIDLGNRGITLERQCTAKELFDTMTDRWEKESFLRAAPFPMVAEGPIMYKMQNCWKVYNPEMVAFLMTMSPCTEEKE